jgi:triphosphatase
MKRQEVSVKGQKIEQSQPTGVVARPSEEGVSLRSGGRTSGADHQEVEWQFDGADLARVEGWLGEGHEGLGIFVESGEEKELTDVYYDTADRKLYRAGYALRIRGLGPRRSEATIKSLASAASGDDARRRREISETLRGEEPGALLSKKKLGPVGEHLRALVGSRELRPLFEVHTCRRTFDLFEVQTGSADGSVESQDDGSLGEIVQDAAGNIRREAVGSRLGEAALDETEIPLGDEPVRFSRVEVEAEVSGEDTSLDLLKEFARAMEEEFGLRPATASKYELGLLAKGLDPEGDLDLGPVAVKKNLSVGEVAFRVLRRQFAAMRAHEGGTRLGEDPEELHDMRVATRRLRSALKFFEDALPEEAGHFRDELKFFAGFLGEVRDLDVQIEQLGTWVSEADEEDREPLSKTVNVLEKRRVAAREELLEALDSNRYERFESSFADFLRRGPAAEGYVDEPVRAVAPDLLSRPQRKWRKAAERVDETSHPEEYHDLRKKGKRFRYALEFLSGVYGEKITGKIVKPLKDLQDELGRHQDLIVSGDLLKQLATESGKLPPKTAFAMGALAERNLQEAASIRASLPVSKGYRKLVKGKTWKGFEKDMEKKQPSAAKTGNKKDK